MMSVGAASPPPVKPVDFGVRDKVVLVTAASGGLGKATAKVFAEAGAKVVICSRNESRVAATVKDIETTVPGCDVRGFRADVTSASDITALAERTLKELGQIDILIANAGGPPSGNFFDISETDWQEATQLTLMSLVRLCYAVVPHMKSRGSGSIVSIQSFLVKNTSDNMILSNSLRLACVGLCKSLANELGPHGIRVNNIGPGYTRTQRIDDLLGATAARTNTTAEALADGIEKRIPLRRMNTAENFARNVCWLASDLGSYINGHSLMVDGGLVQSPL